MEVYKGEKKQQYLEKNSIAHLFSFNVEEFIEVHEYQRDEWIIQEGKRPDFLFYVISGAAKTYVTHQNGKVSLNNFISANDYIGKWNYYMTYTIQKGFMPQRRPFVLLFLFITFEGNCLKMQSFYVNCPNF